MPPGRNVSTRTTRPASAARLAPGTAASAQPLGFSPIGSESGGRAAGTTVTNQEEAGARGIEPRFSNAQRRPENRSAAARTFAAQGVDDIRLAPEMATGWDSALEEAAEPEILVVLLGRMVDSASSPHRPPSARTSCTRVDVGSVARGRGGRGALPRDGTSGHRRLVAGHRRRQRPPQRHRGPRQQVILKPRSATSPTSRTSPSCRPFSRPRTAGRTSAPARVLARTSPWAGERPRRGRWSGGPACSRA